MRERRNKTEHRRRRHRSAFVIAGSLITASAVMASAMTSVPASVPAQCTAASAAGPQNSIVQPAQQGREARAALMHNLGNYRGAADRLRRIIATTDNAATRLDAEVRLARTLLVLRDPECPTLAHTIRLREGTSPAGVQALLTEGDWYFFDGDYATASLCYGMLPDVATKPEYAYRQGICLLRAGKYDKGLRLLEPLAAGNSRYRLPAEFYLAWTDYAQGNLDRALHAFKSVAPRLPQLNSRDNNEELDFMPEQLEAGYYIAQIEFSKGLYAEVVKNCRNLLRNNPDAYYRCELNRLAGESLFKLSDTDAARRYLQEYMRLADADNIAPSAAYALGAIAYGDNDRNEAAKMLEPICTRQGVEGQGAALLLGQMAAEDGNLSSAAMYFSNAWHNNADATLTERAVYNHIAIMAKGAATPFTSSTELPEQFLQRFPGSTYEPQVREYLSAAYYRDHDYARALAGLDKIPHPDSRQQAARQLVLYELGMSELSNGENADAEKHLAAATRGSNRNVAAQAQMWLGQALYAQGKFKASEQAYRAYLQAYPQGENAAQATYDAAYALYMQDDFAKAATEFTRALSMKALPARLRTDATVRLADCRYYLHDYAEAARLYAQAEAAEDGDRAYAAVRAAMMLGLRGDIKAEIAGLKRMTTGYPDSRWTPAALYELATAYAKAGDMTEAAATFSALAERYGQLEEGRRAQLQLANLYAKQEDDEKAIEAYKTVIRRWPTGDEAKAANVELRRIMADQGRIAEYAAFLNSVPGAPKVDNAELEQLAFEAADNRLIASPSNVQPMLDYLRQYPDGLNLAAALWRLAQAYDEQGDYNKALEAITRVEQQRSDARQLPEALILRGEILESHFPQRSAEALQAYRNAERLTGAATPPELYAGIMRLTTDPAESVAYARKLRAVGSLSSEQVQETDFYEARGLAANGNVEAAAKLFKGLATQPSALYGARGAVEYGLLLYSQKKYKEAEKVLTDFTNAGTPHAYWLARGYIALADVCAAQGKKSTARQYLNALKENYPGNEADIQRVIADGLKKYK